MERPKRHEVLPKNNFQGTYPRYTTEEYISKMEQYANYLEEQLELTSVSQQRELLIDFSKKVLFGDDWTPPLPYEDLVDDYLKTINSD
jgi:hypothetical protein